MHVIRQQVDDGERGVEGEGVGGEGGRDGRVQREVLPLDTHAEPEHENGEWSMGYGMRDGSMNYGV